MSRLLAAAVAAGLSSYAPLLGAQAPNVATQESVVTAIVDRVECATRLVTVRASGNKFLTFYVDPAIAAFDDLRAGDEVTVRTWSRSSCR